MDILTMTEEERNEVQQMRIISGEWHREKMNKFIAYAAYVYSIEEIHALQKHLKLKHMDATHIVSVYHLPGEMPDLRDYDDNSEIGCGSKVLDYITGTGVTNVAVFVIRYHSRQNLGSRRFEIYKDLAAAVLQLLQQNESLPLSKLSTDKIKPCKGWQKRTRGRMQGIRGGAFFARGLARQPGYDITHQWQDSDTDPEIVIQRRSRNSP